MHSSTNIVLQMVYMFIISLKHHEFEKYKAGCTNAVLKSFFFVYYGKIWDHTFDICFLFFSLPLTKKIRTSLILMLIQKFVVLNFTQCWGNLTWNFKNLFSFLLFVQPGKDSCFPFYINAMNTFKVIIGRQKTLA